MEEDPQGAGKAPEMWLTALAANPVHLLSKNNALRNTREREGTKGRERAGREVTREASRSRPHCSKEAPLPGLSPLCHLYPPKDEQI